MDLMQQFEYPLPHLKVNTDKLAVEVSGPYQGTLQISNEGGSTLEGALLSNSPFLWFPSQYFSGNKLTLEYEIQLDVYKPGDILYSSIVVMSNGGEKVIPVVVKIIPPAIVTKEEFVIADLKDFMAYAKRYANQARQLFTTQEFMMWLLSINYEYMDIYDDLARDPNKERALENFFILSKLKNKVTLFTDMNRMECIVNPHSTDPVEMKLEVKKMGWGYVEEEIKTQGAPWLSAPEVLKTADFDSNDTAQIPCVFYPERCLKVNTQGKITIGSLSVKVRMHKKQEIELALSKEFCAFQDTAELLVTNNTGTDASVEITPKDSYVRFEGKRYFVGEYLSIPFSVKVPTIQTVQMSIKKQPVLTTEISIAVSCAGQIVRKTLPITIGEFKGVSLP